MSSGVNIFRVFLKAAVYFGTPFLRRRPAAPPKPVSQKQAAGQSTNVKGSSRDAESTTVAVPLPLMMTRMGTP